jgi:YD repeat-containing protein
MRLVLPVCTVLILGLCSLAVVACYSNSRLVSSEGYKAAIQIALSSKELQTALGNEIHANHPIGHVVPFGQSEFAEWSVRLTGSRQSGHLYGIANQVSGVWDYSRLIFETDDRKYRLELTPIRPLSMPRVPTKNVYLVPLGLEGESLDWAPTYYKSKFGIGVTVLPSVPLESGLVDSDRGQVDADKCLDDFIRLKYPDLSRDPSALLLVVTSHDLYSPRLGWSYTENLRNEGRFAIVSSARLHPWTFFEKLNPEWLNSRLQKLLTKNIVLLYFDLPMSSDYTSLLSGGVLSGGEIDQIGGNVIGAEERWDPFWESGAPTVTIYDVAGKDLLWKRNWERLALPDTSAQLFSVSLDVGLLVQRKADFVFPDEPALQFARVYRNQDDRSRAFGIGYSDSFDMFLGGQMGVAVDLIMDDGHRTHFVHNASESGQRGDVYLPEPKGRERFLEAVYGTDGIWRVKSSDGWTYLFPYRPSALPQYVTVLTGFLDPQQQKYEMKRDAVGALLEVNSPSGAWLHVENDSEHRISAISSSTGRTVKYEYDGGGHMVRATDSEGHVDSYTYDEKGQLLTVAHGNGNAVLTNEYFVDGYIKTQTMGNGESFRYAYFRDVEGIHENQVTDPNGLETYVEYGRSGYREWLPTARPH